MNTQFFAKAKDNLRAARTCFDIGLYDSCANRAYYSAFQASVAVLAKFGIKRDKLDHKWVQAEFNAQLISRRKIFPGKFKPYLMKMQLVRDRADYSSDRLGEKTALRQLAKANEMVDLIEKVLK